jgi:hypothetical protein
MCGRCRPLAEREVDGHISERLPCVSRCPCSPESCLPLALGDLLEEPELFVDAMNQLFAALVVSSVSAIATTAGRLPVQNDLIAGGFAHHGLAVAADAHGPQQEVVGARSRPTSVAAALKRASPPRWLALPDRGRPASRTMLGTRAHSFVARVARAPRSPRGTRC